MYKALYRWMSVLLMLACTLASYKNAGAQSTLNNDRRANISALQTSVTRMLIPLYIDPPSTQWTNVINANIYRNIDVILNPADGVGSSQQSTYVNGIAQLRNAGVGIYGYIYTGYGTRSLTTVKAQVDNWKNWYGVDGIFFDEADNTLTNLAYYEDLHTYVSAKGLTSILNPGTNTIESYVSVASTNVIYENDPSHALSLPSWTLNYPASTFGALQYAASAAQMRTFVADAKSKNIGYVFVTDDVLINPWDQLPAYLAEEAALLAGNTALPTATQTVLPSATTTQTITPAKTATPISPTITKTAQPTNTLIFTPTVTATAQPTNTPFVTPTSSLTPLPTSTTAINVSPSPTLTNLPTFTATLPSTTTPLASPTNTAIIISPSPTSTSISSTAIPAGNNIVDVHVTRGKDDVEESSNGTMRLTSGSLDLVFDGSNQVVGIRFLNVNIPKGATITKAYLQFTVDKASVDTTTLLIQGEANSNSTSFTKTKYNVSARSRTTANVTWSPMAWLTLNMSGSDQQTPNLASIVQEIINQAGWTSGNSLVLIITGDGRRIADAYEANAANAPLLHIEYTLPASSAP